LFKNDTKATSTDVPFDGIEGDGFQGIIGKLELDILILEQALVLLDERILGASQNVDQGLLIQIVQGRHYGNTAYKFRNHAEFDQVFRFHLLEDRRAGILVLWPDIAMEPHRAANR